MIPYYHTRSDYILVFQTNPFRKSCFGFYHNTLVKLYRYKKVKVKNSVKEVLLTELSIVVNSDWRILLLKHCAYILCCWI
jgi:hypothetical protein